ncbi:MAG TPA: MBL fold metallo-hydrolase [Allosphingosinicella sp.]|jgi:glyoxylase-like metal-dependent hydrolase (beta-lactamase superfamily II)|nr:MBL fold metallo-hydrolase [Allosphingosinicella sp.]
MKQVGLRIVGTGSCRHPEVATMKGGSWRPATFPALVGFIAHPSEGTILFDTGYDPAFLAATRPFPERLYRWLTPPEISAPAADRLAAGGIDPAAVRHVVLSHFHGDHASGLARFPNATVHCSKAGLSRIWGKGRLRALAAGTPLGLLPSDLPARCSFFEDRPTVALSRDLEPFDSGVDLLGDGALVAVPLPGHCPGHWGLVVSEARGLHFLVADASWSSRAVRENRPPPLVTAAFLGRPGAGRETLARLHRLRARNPDILLTPSHCAERAAEEGE